MTSHADDALSTPVPCPDDRLLTRMAYLVAVRRMTSFGDDRQTNDALRTLEFSARVDRQTSDALRTLDLSERVDRQTNDALSTVLKKVHLFRILLIEFFQGSL